MPTYLTPGVYVEEVPSANKPIEGVSTSIAAFVGLAPGGPVNTPMRISNWTQFAKIYGDPSRAGQRAVHGRRLPRAQRVRVLPERRLAVLGRPRRRRRRLQRARPVGARRAAVGDRRRGRGVQHRRARGRPRRHLGRGDRGAVRRRGRRQDLLGQGVGGFRQRGVHRPDPQEGPHEPRDEGERVLEADQGRGDRRVAARGAARPGHRHVQPVGPVDRPGVRSRARTSRATSPSARAWVAWPRSTRSRW